MSTDLVACQNCGEQLSPYVVTCPRCGHCRRNSRKRFRLRLFGGSSNAAGHILESVYPRQGQQLPPPEPKPPQSPAAKAPEQSQPAAAPPAPVTPAPTAPAAREVEQASPPAVPKASLPPAIEPPQGQAAAESELRSPEAPLPPQPVPDQVPQVTARSQTTKEADSSKSMPLEECREQVSEAVRPVTEPPTSDPVQTHSTTPDISKSHLGASASEESAADTIPVTESREDEYVGDTSPSTKAEPVAELEANSAAVDIPEGQLKQADTAPSLVTPALEATTDSTVSEPEVEATLPPEPIRKEIAAEVPMQVVENPVTSAEYVENQVQEVDSPAAEKSEEIEDVAQQESSAEDYEAEPYEEEAYSEEEYSEEEYQVETKAKNARVVLVVVLMIVGAIAIKIALSFF